MKETAVEFLFKEFCETPKDKFTWYYLFEKAKEMEKQQIIKAWLATDYPLQRIWAAEQYYNETYGDK